MYALPSPSFPPRFSTCTRASSLASWSAIWPVPSGELSSTTSTSMQGSWASTAGTTCDTLVRSLYVGTTTSIRSATQPPYARAGRRPDQEPEGDQQRQPGDHFAAPVVGRRELEPHLARPRGKRHAQEGVIAPMHRRGLAIHRRVPVRIPRLAHQEEGRLWIGAGEGDPHASRLPFLDRGVNPGGWHLLAAPNRLDGDGGRVGKERHAIVGEPGVDQRGDGLVLRHLQAGRKDPGIRNHRVALVEDPRPSR